jgi:hypothetical protein
VWRAADVPCPLVPRAACRVGLSGLHAGQRRVQPHHHVDAVRVSVRKAAQRLCLAFAHKPVCVTARLLSPARSQVRQPRLHLRAATHPHTQRHAGVHRHRLLRGLRPLRRPADALRRCERPPAAMDPNAERLASGASAGPSHASSLHVTRAPLSIPFPIQARCRRGTRAWALRSTSPTPARS